MAKCFHCNKFFLLGGKKQGKLRFCNEDCHQKGFLAPMAEKVAPETVAERIRQMHGQACPICGGDGPVDISTSHTAWAFIILSSWKDHPRLSCKSCGKKAIWRGLLLTSVCGWWSFPVGLIIAPWQIINGLKSLIRLPHSSRPSDELRHMVKLDVASVLVKLRRD